MAKLRAVVLAAGRGVRMGGEVPKCLLELGDHEPMLEHVLNGLKVAGVEDLMVVTGFGAADVETFVTERWGGEAAFIFNARYASWGNFHSLRVALDQSPGHEILVANCDAIVDPEVYARVMSTDGELVLAIEEKLHLDEEDMRVRLSGRRISDIGKDIELRLSQGEYCGVSLLRGTAPRAYQERATDLEWYARTQLYYEDVYRAMLPQVTARAARVEPGEYAEVDTPEDVPAAVAVIERSAARQPA